MGQRKIYSDFARPRRNCWQIFVGRSELWWTFATPNRSLERLISQLCVLLNFAQQQTAATHVSSSDEVCGKQQAVTERFLENSPILVCANAAQQYNCRCWL
jgi:hypothetical protein